MKTRTLAALTIIILCLCLTGRGLRGQAREADQLLVVQTMGLDTGARGVLLSLASAAGPEAEQPPLRLRSEGLSVTAALEQARAGASEEALFCAHLGHLLIGEAAAREGLGPILDYVCRAGELRLSVPVYVLRGAAARDAVLGVGDASFGVCEALDSVDADLRGRGDGRLTEAAELVQTLARTDCALVCAVSLRPSAEEDRSAEAGEPPQTLAADGYGLLRGGKLVGFLDREQAIGAGLLTGHAGACELSVTDQAGLPAALTLSGGHSELSPDRDADGALRGLSVSVIVEAEVAESRMGDTELDYLQRMLERAVAERVRQVLQLSKQWEADFLGLSARLGLQGTDFAALWPTLPVTVSVSARLVGVGDAEGAP